MKLSTLRLLAALALGLTLAACGGKATFQINGTITGLRYDGLVLSNGSDTVHPAANATTFSFPQQVSYGDSYNVTAGELAHQTCKVYGGADTAGRFAAINVTVVCTQNPHGLFVTVTGLGSTDVLELTNGGQTTSFVGNVENVAMGLPVDDGSSYGVVVLTQPTGHTCKVLNGTGIMGSSDIIINVSCTTP
ncbi:MAG: hypothetical protein V4582_07490 [Pseudomonadota bacterium]